MENRVTKHTRKPSAPSAMVCATRPDHLEKRTRLKNRVKKEVFAFFLIFVFLWQVELFSFSWSFPGLVRNAYQTCPEVLSLLRTHTKQLKRTSKRKKSMVKAVGKRMRGAPEPRASRPRAGALPTHPLSDCFYN